MTNDLVRDLRDAAARSLALAVTAREQCRDDLSKELVTRAIRCAARAGTLEAMHAKAKEAPSRSADDAAARLIWLKTVGVNGDTSELPSDVSPITEGRRA